MVSRDKVFTGRELISIFMGDESVRPITKAKIGTGRRLYWDPFKQEYVESETLKYNSSWDWLMPVVKKIYGYLQKMERPSKNHCCKGDLIEVDISCQIREVNLIGAFDKVVDFVKWYNLKK